MTAENTNRWLTLAANLGVIVGIVFLGFEIRQNTNIAKASAYRDNIQDIAEWRSLTISDPELSRLFAVYRSDGVESLEGYEFGRIRALVNNLMGSYETAYFSRNYGVIGDEEWLRFQSAACGHYQTAISNNLALDFITPGFRQFLDNTCELEDPV